MCCRRHQRPSRFGGHTGFTLAEVVVVVMILGILAAIAAPRVLSASGSATDSSVRQTLSVVRTAIDTYAGQTGQLPGADGLEATFKSELMGYLRGAAFPICPVGQANNNDVRLCTGSIGPGIAATAATHSWVYRYDTGDFYVNSNAVSADGVTTYDQF